MKALVVFLLFSMLLFSCNENVEPAPLATGSYSGTFTGHVSPNAVSGTCKVDLVEKDSKISGTLVFSPNVFAATTGTSSFPISGTLTMQGDTVYAVGGTISVGSGVGDQGFGGTISKDKKTITMSCWAAAAFNLKWNLKKN